MRQQRTAWIIGVLALTFVLLLLRLAYLQIVHGEEYAVYARQQRVRIVEVLPRRGDIIDRNGTLLATSRPAYTVSLVYTGRPLPDDVRHRLREILGLSDAEIDHALRELQNYPFRPVPLFVDLTPEQQTRLEEFRHRLDGIVIEAIPVRTYPHGSLAAHVLGYLRQDVGWSLKGVAGLEQVYEQPDPALVGGADIPGLGGTMGKRLVEVDAGGRPVKVLESIEPEPGNTLKLTLDARVQAAAEAALDEVMARLREDPVAPCPCPAPFAAAVVLDVRTGAILAMASRPAYDPNLFALQPFLPRESARRVEIDARIRQYYQSNASELFNRAIQGRYPPGSVFKVVTALAGLENGLESQRVSCGGAFTHAGRTYRDWRAHGATDLAKGIAQSCNVYFWTMGLRLGTEKMGRVARELGLDGDTGLRDLPGERPGAFPWNADPLNTAIGQGQHLYTPLQIAVAVSTIANGGVRYRPYLVDEILTPEGESVYRAVPEVLETIDIPPSLLERVADGMVGVTTCRTGGCGTAYSAFRDAPYIVAGKTGTVERSGLSSAWNYAWFASFAPAGPGQVPEIAVAVLVEGGGGGSRAAAPVARRIYDVYFGLARSPLDPEPSAAQSGGQGAGLVRWPTEY